MLLTLIGALLKLALGFYLYKNDKKTVLLIAPFATVIAYTFDLIGTHFNFWRIRPYHNKDISQAIPIHLTVYPVLASYCIFFIKNFKSASVLLPTFSLLTTIYEYWYVKIKRVRYFNGWNILWTLVSYYIAYYLIYGYHSLLTRNGLAK